MKKSNYLQRRNEIYYFRFPKTISDVRISLKTSNYYEACFLRDKILTSIQGDIMSKNDSFKIKNSELLKKKAKEILEREQSKNKGALNLSFNQIHHFLPEDKVIKDQDFLEECLRRRVFTIEQTRIRNGGRLPDYMVEDLKFCANPNIVHGELTEDAINEIEGCVFISDIDGSKYIPKDALEFNLALKEGYFNIAVEYLAKHYSMPLTPANKDNFKQLSRIGIFSEKNCNIDQVPENMNDFEDHQEQVFNNVKTFQQVVDEYIDEKKLSTDTTENTLDDAVKMLNLAVEFFGADTNISKVNNRPLVMDYKKLLKLLPKNRNKGKYKGKTIHEFSNLKLSDSRLSVATTNKYLMYLTSLLKYAEEREYITKSQAYRLQDKNRIHPRDQNDRFNSEELIALFTKLRDDYGTGNKQEKFWIPLISLFTSCRLNEICQLIFSDLVTIDDIWCFKITTEESENSDKSLKTVYSHRTLPVHQKLIDLGLIEYIMRKKQDAGDEKENIWGLKYEDSRNKYGRTVGRTFNDLRKKLFNPPPRRKTFHSLRHTFATFFRKVADNELVLYFDGHSSRNQTFNRYAKYDDYKWLKEEIDKLKYPQDVEKMFGVWLKENKY